MYLYRGVLGYCILFSDTILGSWNNRDTFQAAVNSSNSKDITGVRVLPSALPFPLAGDCPAHQNCTTCGNTIGCGWCNDPSDTGLGVCAEGGFTESRNSSFCDQDSWYFDQCPGESCQGRGGGGGF